MKNSKLTRTVAIIGIILLLAMFIATLVVAFMDFENKDRVFMALVFSDIVVPVFLYFFLWITKKTRADVREYVDELDSAIDTDNITTKDAKD